MTDAPEKPKSAPRRLRWRTLFKLALLAVVILILIPVLQILVPAVAYQDDLAALLNYSDDCKAPCFMGITPGVTTAEEVKKNTQVSSAGYVNETMLFVMLGDETSYFYAMLDINPEGVVVAIRFRRQIPFSTAMTMFGLPETNSMDAPYYRLENNSGYTMLVSSQAWFSPDRSQLSIFDLHDDTLYIWFIAPGY